MANEFKVKKGLIVTGADGGTVLDVQGSQGQLFSVTDNLSGSIFAVSDVSGVPILDVNSSGEVNIDGTLTCSGNITGLRLRAGDGTNGHFYSDIPGRTAFAAGQFYIQDTVGTYYNYATNQYHGASSGNNHYFRGNNLTGYNWNITAAGAATFAGTIIATQNGGDASIYINNSRPSIAFTDSNSYADANDKYIVRGTGSDRLQFQWYDDSASTTTETFHINSSGDAAFAGNIKINGGVDAGSQLSLFADSNGYTSLAGYTFEINTGNNDARTRSFYIDNNKNATFAGDVTSPTFLGDLNGTINTATTGVTQTAGDDSTKIATTAYADAAAAAVPIGDYLPLSAGSGNGLTGQLWFTGTTDANRKIFFTNAGTYAKGSMDAASYAFQVSGSEKLTIDSSGNVGIGTTSPSAKLDVVGGGQSTSPTLELNSSTSLTFNHVINAFNSNLTTGENQIMVFGKAGSLKNSGYIGYKWIGNNSNENLVTIGHWGSDNLVNIDGVGNVGIGTTSPDALLEISGNAGADPGPITNPTTFRITDAGDAATGAGDTVNPWGKIEFYSEDVSSTGPSVQAQIASVYNTIYSNSSDLQFYTRANPAVPLSTRMTIDGAGNVGIGTTSPDYKLDVEGTGYFSNQLTVDGFANNSGISFRSGFNPTNTGIRAKAIGTANRDGLELLGYNGIDFTVNNGANIAMRIVGATGSGMGNVGIGTTAPSKKLEVNGSFKLGTNSYIEYGGVYPYTITTANTAAVGNLVFSAGLGSAAYESKIDLQGTNTAGVAGITLSTASTARMVVTADGDVGIGTSTPNAKLDIQGTQGQLFSVTDDLSGDIFSVADISGVPIMNVNSDGTSYFDGNVGIGTTSPARKLDVAGTSLFQDSVYVNTSTGSKGLYVTRLGSASESVKIYTTDSTSVFETIQDENVGGYGSMAFILDDGAPDPSYAFRYGSNVRLIIEGGTGNVGIGTTSPTDMLDVNGTSLFRRDLTIYHKGNNSSPSYELRFKGTNSSGVDKVHASLESSPYVTDTNAGTLLFKTANASNQILDTRMVIDGVGNVGIGTTSPESGYKLDVNGAVSINSVINVSGVDGTNSVSAANNVRLSGYGLMGNRGGLYFTNGDPNGNIQFGVGGVHASNTKLYISSTGNVGIGTTSPTANLHIQENSDPASSVSGLKLSANASGTNKYLPAIEWSYGANGTPSFAKIETIRASSTGGILAFSTATTSSVMTERIRIDSSGNVGIGTTSFSGKLSVKEAGSGVYFTRNSGDNGTTGPVLAFANDSTKSIIAAAGDGIIFRTRTVGGAAFSGSEKMRITSTGNVGIGVTGPSARIHTLYSGLAAKFVSSQATGLEVQGGGNGQPIARFKDTSAAEKVTISSTGNVGIGNTSPADKLDVVGISRFTHSSSTSYRGAIETVVDNAYPTWDIGWLHARTGSSTYGNVARFNDQSGFQIGAITYNGSAGVSYATTSDYRLKENIEEISDSISRVKKLKPCRFNFTAEKNRVVDGFIAHEVQKVVPEAVHGKKDALQEDGSIDAQTLEVSRLIPVLTKALQEAIIKIEELELRIQTIENN